MPDKDTAILPSLVARITVTNPTVYEIGIDVTGNDDDGWIAVGTRGEA